MLVAYSDLSLADPVVDARERSPEPTVEIQLVAVAQLIGHLAVAQRHQAAVSQIDARVVADKLIPATRQSARDGPSTGNAHVRDDSISA